MRRRGWHPPSDARRAWQIDDAEARALARAYANDRCGCGHYRVEHTGRGCRRCRRCSGYALAGAPSRAQWDRVR